MDNARTDNNTTLNIAIFFKNLRKESYSKTDTQTRAGRHYMFNFNASPEANDVLSHLPLTSRWH
ncbi:hypothetical protein, partial [Vibrio cholerae]|uniref:hypothetical protein n=1 Tax=Vibrio cholerae TaxID=666 RepID=UPI001F1C3A52